MSAASLEIMVYKLVLLSLSSSSSLTFIDIYCYHPQLLLYIDLRPGQAVKIGNAPV